ncbi:hypothetical protein Tco_1037774, partial [Tanacetum coccineum]
FKMEKFRETLANGTQGPEWDRVFKDLTLDEKDRYKADVRATNILLQGSELTRDEHESQLYDDFKHFRYNKGETIHEYYVRFTNLINDMRNIKMTMPKMQLNSKFMNNMLLEWGRFVIAVKLNIGLKTFNYDQLYAYLKQHKVHANENKMMLERYTQHAIDPFAFVSNISLQQYPIQSSTLPQSGYIPPITYQPQFAHNTHLDSRLTPSDDLIENLTKIFKTAGLWFRMFRVDRTKFRGTMQRKAIATRNGGVQNRVSNANPDFFKDKMLLMQAQKNGVVLDEEQLLFIAGGQDNNFDDVVDEPQTMFMANLSSTDPIYDEVGPSYDSNILSENYVVDFDAEYMSDSNIIPFELYVKNNVEQVVQSNVSSMPNDALMMIINDMHEQAVQCTNEHNKVVNKSLTAELARYKEQVKIYEKRARFELTEREQKIDEQLRIIITNRNIQEESLKKELHSVKIQLNSTIAHNKLMKDEVATLKKDFK